MTEWSKDALEESRGVLSDAISKYSPDISLACSFSSEDILIFSLMKEIDPKARMFALDTGRLDPETYECAEAVRSAFDVDIEWYFPKTEAVENLESTKGVMSFRGSVDARKECCAIRKMEPLERALSGLNAWVTGLRRSQSVTRESLAFVEDDAARGIVKINPLINWTFEQVTAYVREQGLPHNKLLDSGYRSIGCAPCTRAVRADEDERAGRWWWEVPEHKECGLHLRMENGK